MAAKKGTIKLGKDLQRSRGGSTPPEGQYVAQIVGFEEKDSKSGSRIIKATFQILEGDYEGKNIPHYFAHETDFGCEQLAACYFALNSSVDHKVLEVAPSEMKGKKLIIDLKHEEYEGTTRAKIKTDGYSEYEDDGSSGKKPAVKKASPKKDAKKKEPPEEESNDEEEEEEEEGDEGDELDNMDRKALRTYIKTNKLEVRVLKRHSDDDLRTEIRKALEADEDNGDEQFD